MNNKEFLQHIRDIVDIKKELERLDQQNRPKDQAGNPKSWFSLNEVAYPVSNQEEKLLHKEYDIMANLLYEDVIKIEAAMLLGRDLYLKEKLPRHPNTDIEFWIDYYDIPKSTESGGNKDMAISYTLAKTYIYLEKYYDTVCGYNAEEWA